MEPRKRGRVTNSNCDKKKNPKGAKFGTLGLLRWRNKNKHHDEKTKKRNRGIVTMESRKRGRVKKEEVTVNRGIVTQEEFRKEKRLEN